MVLVTIEFGCCGRSDDLLLEARQLFRSVLEKKVNEHNDGKEFCAVILVGIFPNVN